ncbi:hypothetical protein F4780DRAFT_356903 [Xylariomycetidae sp. FL0641]|nr:hypothetical protein F4780DRAFT_356903 [Xylariomycetidae sp. FL0641]
MSEYKAAWNPLLWTGDLLVQHHTRTHHTLTLNTNHYLATSTNFTFAFNQPTKTNNHPNRQHAAHHPPDHHPRHPDRRPTEQQARGREPFGAGEDLHGRHQQRGDVRDVHGAAVQPVRAEPGTVPLQHDGGPGQRRGRRHRRRQVHGLQEHPGPRRRPPRPRRHRPRLRHLRPRAPGPRRHQRRQDRRPHLLGRRLRLYQLRRRLRVVRGRGRICCGGSGRGDRGSGDESRRWEGLVALGLSRRLSFLY